jgi:hypothetical protein
VFDILESHTFSCKLAMMIPSEDTETTRVAMIASRRTIRFTGTTESVTFLMSRGENNSPY